jgi:F420-non-reducing hydrogenase iron-sulfur subunit
MTDDTFEPTVLVLACQHRGYAAADLAGSMHLEYPANVRIVRIPCSGKTDTLYLLRAFEEGVDAVFVAACKKGLCHYLEGNYSAERRVNYTKQLLDELGLGGDRLAIYFFDAAEGPKFVQAVREMTARARELGPNPLKAVSTPVPVESAS